MHFLNFYLYASRIIVHNVHSLYDQQVLTII